MTTKLVVSLTERRVDWIKKTFPKLPFGHAVTRFAIEVQLPRVTVAQWFKTEWNGKDVIPRDSTLDRVLLVYTTFPH